jgi:hypothetical protein
MSGAALERFPPSGAPAPREGRKARTRAAIVLACRPYAGGVFRPPPARCDRAQRSIRESRPSAASGVRPAAADPSTGDAIVERVLGCERTALSAETQQRLVRALVTGAA